MRKIVSLSLFLGLCWCLEGAALAGAPLTNFEGVGGCALNPFAYVANPVKGEAGGLLGSRAVSRPQVGVWTAGLTESDIDWWSVGANIAFFNRLELGYSHEFVDIEGIENVDKDNLSLKVNLVQEGGFGIGLLPAVSAGAIWKHTEFSAAPARDVTDVDGYVVATKMFGALPVPVILNAGLLWTKGYVRGVLGFGDDRDTVFFGNVETVLPGGFIVGWEYQQDADVGRVIEGDATRYTTHSIWEAHAAYMPNPNLTLVASYADTGDRTYRKTAPLQKRAAFGRAYVLSIQYAF
ncbi:DUF3034 family protein [Dissulfurirhabdus thermomarina]|uniref:DUF3034 family protein n=1 Tax=Dissulfurirhabdus thermomarina TaxID=1765737 RepID=A0A6N9TJF9_DISTH|nr:DUF3034 family protein [Dissulfurirhabdus thermomarina]NDY41391.1 DUF3034 family protein [Dissulfurirhabdus thermomarina]NMX23593.1 DUF3034 family protein [Dissulfurirhabdus thermomarina]